MSQKTMVEIKCTKCGNSATVPFKPTAGKPVYCKSCYSKSRSNKRNTSNLTKKFDVKNKWAMFRDDWQGQKEKSHNIFSAS
jgi:CxxC-x17-CxxC domain-containing protein